MGSKTFYPASVKAAVTVRKTPNDSCGVACKSAYQAMTGASNICNDNSKIAYWGDRFPDKTNSKNPLYYYPNTLTSYSGSWNIPSPFTITKWNIPTNISDKLVVTKITLEYAITHVKYQDAHVQNAGWSYSSDGCKFYVNELSQGAANYREPGCPCKSAKYHATPYTYTLKGFGQNRSVSGQGLRYADITTKNLDEYSSMSSYSDVIYTGHDKTLTIGKLRNTTLEALLPRNLNGAIGRIVMKYLRICVEWEDPTPIYDVTTATSSSNQLTTCNDSSARINVKIKTTNGYIDDANIIFTNNGDISNISMGSKDTFNGNIWHVDKESFSNGIATLSYDVHYSTNGSKNITINTGNSTKTIPISVQLCQPNFDFQFLEGEKNVNDIYSHPNNNKYLPPYEFLNANNKIGCFKLVFERNDERNDDEYLEITSNGLEFKHYQVTLPENENGINVQSSNENLKYTITNINNQTKIIAYFYVDLNIPGKYTISGTYKNNTSGRTHFTKEKAYNIIIKGETLSKDYFRMRLEDGSDVRYNSLMFTQGDDLEIPITYTIDDDKNTEGLIIHGGKKRIPINEVQYINIDIDLLPYSNFQYNEYGELPSTVEYERELKNVLTYIEVVSDGFRRDDIIVGTGNGVKLLSTDNDEKICVIDSIKTGETKTVKLAVQSPIEQECYIFLKPYNIKKPYSYENDDERKWTPAQVLFKDIPNIKMWIEGPSEINTNNDEDSYFSLYYHIQNLSNVNGKYVRFQLKEPYQFNKIGYQLYDNDEQDITNNDDPTTAWFNPNNRVLTFPILESSANDNRDYRLRVDYKATQRGIYDFIIKTLDSPLTLEDDQYENYYTHKLLVDIFSDVKIKTTTNKNITYVNEVVDFNINVKNRFKKQKQFTFDIYDFGKYDENHQDSHYEVQPFVYCEYGEFIPNNDSNDKQIGTWILKNIKDGAEYNLGITLNPTQEGVHVIKTRFVDADENSKSFENPVRVLAEKKQIDFNVYQAVNDEDVDCQNCDVLDKICDDDFINLGDKIYYVFEITNNNRNPIENPIHVYARLPKSFLTDNKILCSSYKYHIDSNSSLIRFTIPTQQGHNEDGSTFIIPSLQGCNEEGSTFKFCMKVEPHEIGKFISNFSLSTKNAPVLYKQLKLTVDTEFNERKLEHEINIYNFDKTNKYYRYEIDNVGEIFKFFNEGDKSLRLINKETYNQSAIETYKGTNLKKLVRDIQEHSKYVDPLFLREGSNKLQDKGYELYPDGLIRRFGLLSSEVFHYSNQLPITSNLVDRAMKWDIDTWDTKKWAGDIYDNGIFDLTIDYSKVPSNFNILDVENPIQNLQSLVDNTKPYGTKAICYYSATSLLKLNLFINHIQTMVNNNLHLYLKIPENKFGLISEYNRHDRSLAIYYDMFRMNLNTIIKDASMDMSILESKDTNTISTSITDVSTAYYPIKTDKRYIQDCYDIISNIYSTKEKNNNIDIIKPYNFTDFTQIDKPTVLNNQQIVNFINNLSNNQSLGIIVTEDREATIYTYDPHYDDGIITGITENNISFIFERDDENYFNGFKILIEDNVIESYNITEAVTNISMQVQLCTYNDFKVLHFWGSINDGDYYHIGHILTTGIRKPHIKLLNESNTRAINGTAYTCNKNNPVVFKLSDRVNVIKKDFDYIEAIEKNNKWKNLKNINHNKGKYAIFTNDINIDPECTNDKVNIPTLVLKYNNIDLDNTDEIVDIGFKIDADSNKENFMQDININLYKDGDAYIPDNNLAKEMHYPLSIKNQSQQFLTTIQIEQPNMTICSECMKTSLGYYDTCQYCGNTNVYHTNEKIPATVCHNCGYIIEGWHDHCTHCLSYDIDRIKIDYNKTYCHECGQTSDDYYNHCPYCFTSNVTHLSNNKNVYEVFDSDTTNIDPIHIDVAEEKVNIFNLEIPSSKNKDEMNKLTHFDLYIQGENNSNTEYYYCEACGIGGLGNYKYCPHCESPLVHNYQDDNYYLEIYYKDIKKYEIYSGAQKITSHEPITIDKIDLQSLIKNNPYDSFSLLFYIKNTSYNDIYHKIDKLPIDDEYKGDILYGISSMKIDITNIYADYQYKDAKEWQGLDKFYHDSHTGVQYKIPYNKRTSDKIKFSNFDIKTGKYKHAYLFVHGIMKDTPYGNINVEIKNGSNTYRYDNKNYTITDNIFNFKFDLTQEIGETIKDIEVVMYFTDVEPKGQITILDCSILTEKVQSTHIIHDNINDIHTTIKGDKLITSPNIWGLKDTLPYYLSGRQLMTNLIGYLDFGSLDLREYIKIYNIEMIILYKNKSGQLITESIPVPDSLNGNILSEQIFNGSVEKINGETWISLKHAVESLNNLDYEISNIPVNDEILNAIPLYNKIAQSFTLDTSEISQISINYYKSRGYPSDIINIYLCEDDDNKPGRIIRGNKVHINRLSENINIDIDAYDLDTQQQYWFVLEDTSANKFNYHQFKYNNNTDIGHIIRYEDDEIVHDTNNALSFSINSNDIIKEMHDLPVFWSIDEDSAGLEYDDYKMYVTFYRYNIQDNSNISISNLHINNGYIVK